MNCQQTRNLMNPVLDGELASSRLNEFQAHLTACSHCRREFTSLQHAVDFLTSTAPIAPPPDLAENVLRRIRLPLWPRLLNEVAERVPVFVIRPTQILTAIALISIIWLSYVTIFDHLRTQLSWQMLYQPLLNLSDTGQIAFILSEALSGAIYLFRSIVGLSAFFYDSVKLFLQVMATLLPALSYILPTAIVLFLIWTSILHYITLQTRRLHYVYATN